MSILPETKDPGEKAITIIIEEPLTIMRKKVLPLAKEKGKQGYLFCYHVLNLLTFVFPKLREKVGELYYRSMKKEN